MIQRYVIFIDSNQKPDKCHLILCLLCDQTITYVSNHCIKYATIFHGPSLVDCGRCTSIVTTRSWRSCASARLLVGQGGDFRKHVRSS